MPILETRELSYFFRDGDNKRYILSDASWGFERGRMYAIVGESGSGKTTFLSLIAALDSPNMGSILFEGKDIKDIGYESYRRNNVGIVFQNYNFIPYLTAVENVLVAMDITDNDIPSEKRALAYNLLDYIGIDSDKANRSINNLSGGEQQRVAIARSLATDVDLIVADEPTGNLNAEMEREIIEIFKTLAHEHGKCVILVTHSPEVASTADETIRLDKGVLIKDERVL